MNLGWICPLCGEEIFRTDFCDPCDISIWRRGEKGFEDCRGSGQKFLFASRISNYKTIPRSEMIRLAKLRSFQ